MNRSTAAWAFSGADIDSSSRMVQSIEDHACAISPFGTAENISLQCDICEDGEFPLQMTTDKTLRTYA
jgi:hypothetical protein